jgi:hypothetical protein
LVAKALYGNDDRTIRQGQHSQVRQYEGARFGADSHRYLSDPDRKKANRAMQAMMKMQKIVIADLDRENSSRGMPTGSPRISGG